MGYIDPMAHLALISPPSLLALFLLGVLLAASVPAANYAYWLHMRKRPAGPIEEVPYALAGDETDARSKWAGALAREWTGDSANKRLMVFSAERPAGEQLVRWSSTIGCEEGEAASVRQGVEAAYGRSVSLGQGEGSLSKEARAILARRAQDRR